MSQIRVAPRNGSTVRFPESHALAGEIIPPEGVLVSDSERYYTRLVLRGELLVLSSKAPGSSSGQVTEAAPAGPDGVELDEAELQKWPKGKLAALAAQYQIPIPDGASKGDILRAILDASTTL